MSNNCWYLTKWYPVLYSDKLWQQKTHSMARYPHTWWFACFRKMWLVFCYSKYIDVISVIRLVVQNWIVLLLELISKTEGEWWFLIIHSSVLDILYILFRNSYVLSNCSDKFENLSLPYAMNLRIYRSFEENNNNKNSPSHLHKIDVRCKICCPFVDNLSGFVGMNLSPCVCWHTCVCVVDT